MSRGCAILAMTLLLAVGCGGSAQFRPATGVKDYPSSKDAFRVQEPPEDCIELGHVVHAQYLSDLAEAAASHGGTHYVILSDNGSTSVETTGTAHSGPFGTTSFSASSQRVKHHSFIARVYRCS